MNWRGCATLRVLDRRYDTARYDGRNDSSIPFYDCKVFPSDIEQILLSDLALA